MQRSKRVSTFRPRLDALEARALMNVDVAWTDGLDYDYKISGVPDFDQRRAFDLANSTLGLLGDGAMYCVPTAAFNWAAYIANHGYYYLSPGVQDWTVNSPALYQDATLGIQEMGFLMGTDPAEGTKGGARSGLQAWLDDDAPGFFTVSRYGHSDFLADDMAKAAIDGNLVLPEVGWYTSWERELQKLVDNGLMTPAERLTMLDLLHAADVDTEALWKNGGHVLSLVEAHYGGWKGRSFGFNDPSSGTMESMTQQSPFAQATFPVRREQGVFDGETRIMHRVVGYRTAHLKGYLTVRPKFGLATIDDAITVYRPIQLGGPDEPVSQTYRTVNGGHVLDLAVHPELVAHPYLAAGDTNVWQVDSLTGASRSLARLEAQPKRLVFGGREQNLFVLDERGLTRLSRDGAIEMRITLTRPLDAIAWDDQGERLIGYSGAEQRLDFFDRDLRATGSVSLPLPPSDPGQIGQGPARMGVSSRDGSLWIHRDGSNQVHRIEIDARGGALITPVTLQGAESPTGFAIDDSDMLYVSDGGVMKVFDRDGRGVDSPFTGLPGGGQVQILCAFDSYDPRTADTLADRNVLPEDSDNPAGPFMTRLGDTVIVAGDARANRVEIVDQGSRGVHIGIDAHDNHQLQGVERIIVITGEGDDIVDFRAAEGIPLIRTLRIDTGAGNDTVSVNIGDTDPPQPDADPPQPDMPAELEAAFHIDTGAGDDIVDFRAGAGIPLIRTFVPDVHGRTRDAVVRTNMQLNRSSREQLVAGVFGDADVSLTLTGIEALDAVFAQRDGGPGFDLDRITRNVRPRAKSR